jgi:hypothetical protein
MLLDDWPCSNNNAGISIFVGLSPPHLTVPVAGAHVIEFSSFGRTGNRAQLP